MRLRKAGGRICLFFVKQGARSGGQGWKTVFTWHGSRMFVAATRNNRYHSIMLSINKLINNFIFIVSVCVYRRENVGR